MRMQIGDLPPGQQLPGELPVNPYIGVALASGGASVLVALVGCLMVNHFMQVSDGTLWAIAAMVAAPSAMGVGIAYFMSRQPPKGGA